MQVESIIKPSKYNIENLENGKLTVSFFDNIEEVEILENEETITKYVYDFYKIELRNRSNLLGDIQKNYDVWLQFAKDLEYENLAKEIRNKRDKLLTDTDWTQITDTALNNVKQKEYKSYRQQLRDITEQKGFPYEVTFPIKPIE